MARFIIEVPHEGKAKECALAVKVLLSSGSHYLTHAEFGCLDGEHKAWIIVEVDSKEEARFILPPVYRPTSPKATAITCPTRAAMVVAVT